MAPSRLVYLSPVSSDSFAQRPHHFVKWFHDRHDAPVLWLEPYPARLPQPSDWRRLQRASRAQAQPLGPEWTAAPWFEALRVPALPFEPLPAGRAINRWLWAQTLRRIDAFVDERTVLVFAKGCALALELAARYPGQTKIFDVMDNLPAFATGRSRQWLEDVEAALATRCDGLLASSRGLHAKLARHPAPCLWVPNGLTESPVASLDAGRSCDTLVLGYIGVIARWFDWEAVIGLADRLPQATIRLIGPRHGPIPSRLPANVELRPAIAQDQVYAAMHDFTFGLIPFKRDALTDAVDPVKYYEYRAMGLPVLSTRFGDMRGLTGEHHVLFFEDAPGADTLQQAVSAAAAPETVAAFRKGHSWRARFDAAAAQMSASGVLM